MGGKGWRLTGQESLEKGFYMSPTLLSPPSYTGGACYWCVFRVLVVIVLLLYRLWSMEAREEQLCQLGLRTLRSNPRIAILGDNGRTRLPIFSFLIRQGNR